MSIDVSIQKDFGSFQLNVSFQGKNEVLAILGGSGCGKSMTLRCIAGIVKPDQGHIEVDGVTFFDSRKKINLSPQERKVGLLFQNYALFSNMTVAENIAAGVREKVSKREKMDRVQPYIKKFRLESLEKRLPHELSGGQQQRVALARILIGNPRILMLDEPFSALDSYLRWEMELELKETLKEFSGSTLLVSHSRDEVYRIAQKVCVIDHGVSQPVQTVHDLFEHPTTHAAALLSGCKNYARCSPVEGQAIHVSDWGLTLQCSGDVPADTTMLGIRRHYVFPAEEGGVNTFPCTIREVIDDVFSTIVIVHPCNAPADSRYPALELEMPKERWRAQHLHPGDRFFVQIPPEHLLLLH